jgi:hypothetical protein
VFAALLFSAVLMPSQARLHPALRLSMPVYEKGWQQGIADGGQQRKAIQREDRISHMLFDKHSYSPRSIPTLIVLDPLDEAYFAAQRSITEHWTPEAVRRIKAKMAATSRAGRSVIAVQGTLAPVVPVDDVNHPGPRPADFRDVQLFLQVGNRRFRPRAQPGTPPFWSGSAGATARYLEPIPGSGCVWIAAQKSFVSLDTYWYTCHFTVAFDLFDKNGSARIGPRDHRFTIIIRWAGGERQLDCDLAAIQKSHE